MHRIAEQIKGIEFDWYIAISRGGLVPAALLSQITGQRNIDTYCVSRYENGTPVETNITHKSFYHLACQNILIVDDILDHGVTASIAMRQLKSWQDDPNCYIRLAILYWKERSEIKPDYYIEKCDNNKWIEFPWELEQNLNLDKPVERFWL
jgi:hypoxanthine phosphoribosyltransferase